MIAPKATGNCSTGPFIPLVSAGFSAGSLPAKSTVAGLQVGDAGAGADRVVVDGQALGLRFEPHCW